MSFLNMKMALMMMAMMASDGNDDNGNGDDDNDNGDDGNIDDGNTDSDHLRSTTRCMAVRNSSRERQPSLNTEMLYVGVF